MNWVNHLFGTPTKSGCTGSIYRRGKFFAATWRPVTQKTGPCRQSPAASRQRARTANPVAWSSRCGAEFTVRGNGAANCSGCCRRLMTRPPRALTMARQIRAAGFGRARCMRRATSRPRNFSRWMAAAVQRPCCSSWRVTPPSPTAWPGRPMAARCTGLTPQRMSRAPGTGTRAATP